MLNELIIVLERAVDLALLQVEPGSPETGKHDHLCCRTRALDDDCAAGDTIIDTDVAGGMTLHCGR
jgi:hypothetical protein